MQRLQRKLRSGEAATCHVFAGRPEDPPLEAVIAEVEPRHVIPQLGWRECALEDSGRLREIVRKRRLERVGDLHGARLEFE